jgi:hypothetical protein
VAPKGQTQSHSGQGCKEGEDYPGAKWVPDHDGPPLMPVVAAVAIRNVDFEAWKPWLREVCKLCDVEVPEMPLLKDHNKEHMLPPKHRPKYNGVWQTGLQG